MAEAAAVSAPAPSAPSTPAPAANAPATPDSSAAPKSQPADKGTPAQVKKWELKINGNTQQFTEQELISRASQAEAADQRFKEGARLRKEAESLTGRFRDPKQMIAALQDPALGLTKDQIRAEFEEWYSKEFIEAEKLSPAEKRARDAEARIKKYEDEERGRADQKLKEQQEAMTAQAREQIQKQIVEALDTSGLPKTNFTIRRLAYWMQRNHANGYDAPINVIVDQVRNEMNTSLRDMVESSDGEVLLKLLGDNIVQKIRKYDLAQLRKTRNPQAVSQSPGIARTETKSERPLTSAEVNQRIRSLQRTGKY